MAGERLTGVTDGPTVTKQAVTGNPHHLITSPSSSEEVDEEKVLGLGRVLIHAIHGQRHSGKGARLVPELLKDSWTYSSTLGAEPNRHKVGPSS